VTVGILPIRRALLRPPRDGAILACVGIAVIHLVGLTRMGVDAHAYWNANPLAPYGATAPAAPDAYFYAPVFTQALWPFHALPWEWFAAFWTLVLTAALVWQAGLPDGARAPARAGVRRPHRWEYPPAWVVSQFEA
jgi:hypothetical protein